MDMLQPVDLHCHSNLSDGKLTPIEVTDLMADKGVKFFSLTDHDSVKGCAIAAERAAERGIGFLPGVEISADYQDKSLHVLGLGIDIENEELLEFLQVSDDSRMVRFQLILDRLAHFGMDLNDEFAHLDSNTAFSRQHIAEALVKRGYAANKGEAFRKYLLKGGAAYLPMPWPGLEKSIAVIHRAGGVAVLAHPGRYGYTLPGLRALFRAFRDAGGDGAEVSSGPAALGMVQRLSQLCTKFGLMVSGGSDFHDPRSAWVKAGEYQQIPRRLTRIWQQMDWWHPPEELDAQ